MNTTEIETVNELHNETKNSITKSYDASKPLLSPREEQFAQRYSANGKKREAAIEAGYAAANAAVYANRLLKKLWIKNRVDYLVQKAIKEAGIEYERKQIIADIVSICTDDISNYLEFRTMEVMTEQTDGSLVPDIRPTVILKDSANIDTKNIQSISIAKDGTFSIKLYSRADAIEKITKIKGMYTATDVNVKFPQIIYKGADQLDE